MATDHKKDNIHANHRKRMRERYLKAGLDTFADHEVLELLLYHVHAQKNTNPLAHELMNTFGSLNNVLSSPMEELMSVNGIGEVSAFFISLIPQVYKRAQLNETANQVFLNSPEAISKYLINRFACLKQEMIYQLCINNSGKLLACKELTIGSPSSVELDTRLVITNAILTSAASVVLAHNQLSGSTEPSRYDIDTTIQVQRLLEGIGVRLADHMIISGQEYYSMAGAGILCESFL